MKKSDWLIGFFLLLSIWTISRVDLDVVWQNLSYSYVAGAIVYFFTVKLPYWRKRKTSKELIDRIIYDFHLHVNLINSCYHLHKGLENPLPHKDVHTFDEIARALHSDLEKMIDGWLCTLPELYSNFTRNMIDFREYLSDEQYEKLVNILKSNFAISIQSYCMQGMEIINETEEIYEFFTEFVSLIIDFKKSTNKNK